VVSIPACHAGDPGSIPGLGVFVCFLTYFIICYRISVHTSHFWIYPYIFSQIIFINCDAAFLRRRRKKQRWERTLTISLVRLLNLCKMSSYFDYPVDSKVEFT
jgi:hypothetical protein